MENSRMTRLIMSISKWYFIEFFLHYKKQDDDIRFILLNSDDELFQFIYAHYDSVKRKPVVNHNGLLYRYKRLRTLLKNDEMEEALIFIAYNTKNKKITSDAINLIEEFNIIVNGVTKP